MLVDLPRSTAYEILTRRATTAGSARATATRCRPAVRSTVTAVFTAPPAEATELTVFIDGLLPVAVPVQPAGSPTLVDDPVLRATGSDGPSRGSGPCSAPRTGRRTPPGRSGR